MDVLTDRSLFNPLHPPGTIENNLPAECFKGYVDPAITAKANAVRDAEKRRIAAAREALPPVETILGLDEFEVSVPPFCNPLTPSRHPCWFPVYLCFPFIIFFR